MQRKTFFSFDCCSSKFFRYISGYTLLCLHFLLNKNDIRHLVFVRQVLLCYRVVMRELHWTLYMAQQYRYTSTIFFYEIVSNMSWVQAFSKFKLNKQLFQRVLLWEKWSIFDDAGDFYFTLSIVFQCIEIRMLLVLCRQI